MSSAETVSRSLNNLRGWVASRRKMKQYNGMPPMFVILVFRRTLLLHVTTSTLVVLNLVLNLVPKILRILKVPTSIAAQ
jgi:hypothetical protein